MNINEDKLVIESSDLNFPALQYSSTPYLILRSFPWSHIFRLNIKSALIAIGEPDEKGSELRGGGSFSSLRQDRS